MGDIITFNRLKLGEIVTVEANDEKYKCEVLSHEGNNVYKLRVLEGKHKGQFCYFGLERMEHE